MTKRHARHRSYEAHRTPAMLLVGLGVVGVAALSLLTPSQGISPSAATPADAVAPAGSISSTFTCVGMRQGLSSAIVASSANSQAVTGTLTVLGQHGVESVRRLQIEPKTTYRIALPNRTFHAWSSAVIQWNGGGISVAQTLAVANTWTTTPCRSTVSDAWYFGDGVTTLHTGTTLVVANPTSTTAVISAQFFTPHGPLEPQGLQGVVIPAQSTVALGLSQSVVHQSLFATKVTANSGRVVASLVELGLSGSQVLTVVQGVTSCPKASMLPFTVISQNQVQQFTVTNFSPNPTMVSMSVQLPSGSLPTQVIHLEGRSIGAIDPALFRGIPHGYPFSIRFTSSSSAGVLAIRLDRAFPQAVEYRTVETARATTPAATQVLLNPIGLAGGRSSIAALGIQSMSSATMTVHFASLGGGQLTHDIRPPLVLGPHQYVSVGAGIATAGGRNAVIVSSSGQIVLSSRANPGGSPAGPGYEAVPFG